MLGAPPSAAEEHAPRGPRRRGKRKVFGPKDLKRIRRKELGRLFAARYGRALPNDSMGRNCANVLAQTIAAVCSNASGIALAIEFWCPWMPRAEAQSLADRALADPQFWDEETIGQRLHLTTAEYTRLAIRTIHPFDTTAVERAALRKERKRVVERDRRRRKREADGGMTRAEYEAQSLSQLMPWDALGISRRTWERRRKQAADQTRRAA